MRICVGGEGLRTPGGDKAYLGSPGSPGWIRECDTHFYCLGAMKGQMEGAHGEETHLRRRTKTACGERLETVHASVACQK